MLASIVIPAYNAGPHFDECLNSLSAQTCQDFEVIWVDNASTDDSLRRVRKQFPQVRILALDHNAGYRDGCRVGAELARGKYLVICNQDVRLEATWLEALVACAEGDPEIGIVAPKIMLYDRPHLVNEAGNTLQYCGLFTSRGLEAPAADFDRQEPLATMSGCAFLIRRELWVQFQGFSADFDTFDTGFHAAFEDVDLAWRVQLLGYQVAFCPTAVMYHKFERKNNNLQLFHGYEWNRYMILLRNYRLRSLVLLAPLLLAVELAACLFAVSQGWRSLGRKLRVHAWFLTHLGLLRDMRARIQVHRAVRDRVVVARMSASLSLARAIGTRPLTRHVQSLATAVLTGYHRAFLLALRVLEPAAVSSGPKLRRYGGRDGADPTPTWPQGVEVVAGAIRPDVNSVREHRKAA